MTEKAAQNVVSRSFGSFHSSNIDEQLKLAEDGRYSPPEFLINLPKFASYQKLCPQFGRSIKKLHFHLTDEYVFLNHGAFGAALKDALEVSHQLQIYIESQPVRFIDREMFSQIVSTHFKMAGFVGCKPSDFVLVENATTGTNSVLNSLKLNEYSTVYHLNTIYGAVKKSLARVCSATGAKIQAENLSFPLESEKEIVDLVERTLKPNTTIALFDHIPSNMGFVMPMEKLIKVCHERNVPVCVDGAHALGSTPLDLHDLDADYYVTNAHKWLCCPKGCAILYVKPDLQGDMKPLSVSHGYASGFRGEFTFTGLRDYTPYLAVQCCLNFWLAIGPDTIRARMKMVLKAAVQILVEAWDAHTLAPLEMHSSMCCVSLPSRFYENKAVVTYDDAEAIQNRLFHEHKIEVPLKCVGGKLYVRISAHIYNEVDEYKTLANAVLSL